MLHDFPAHMALINGIKKIHTAKDHCAASAFYARKSLENVGLGKAACAAAMLHDMGKFTKAFEDYITRAYNGENVKRGSVNHTFAAVVFIIEKYGSTGFESCFGELMAFACGAHHGLFDCADEEKSGFKYRLGKNKIEINYDEAYGNYFENCISHDELDVLLSGALDEAQSFFNNIKKLALNINSQKTEQLENLYFLSGLWARLMLSAVINGDRRDTAEFFADAKFPVRTADSKLWHKTKVFCDEKVNALSKKGEINAARGIISEACANFEAQDGGIYKISVPTGAGKTLAMLRFSLSQAERLNKKRIIFIIPLLSVLDQNKDVIKEYTGDESIIFEHHSNVIRPSADEKAELDKYELLCQSWDSPIIISTLVQLLNTLFSSRTEDIRRMQALCDSIIVIDEVQSLPKKTTYMFNMALDFLSRCCKATIVLSTATQPCFDSLKKNILFSKNADIVPYDSSIWNVFKRTEILDETSKAFENEDELAKYISKSAENVQSVLVICNTKKTAAGVFTSLKALNPRHKLYHLSNAMCMAHRKTVLSEINSALDSKEPVICVSTQLVEAGVDFSFESVIRVMAGLDNIAQSAGRCNRNGESKVPEKVHVVKLKNESLKALNEIETAQSCFMRFMSDYKADSSFYGDILSPKSVKRYFELLYEELKGTLYYTEKIGCQSLTLFSLLAENSKVPKSSKNSFLNQAFKTAGRLFKVFDENTTDVFVPYNAEAEEIINGLFSVTDFDFEKLHSLLEKAKPYTVSLFKYQLENLEADGLIYGREMCKNKELYERLYVIQKTAYDSEKGITDSGKPVLIL